MKKKTLKGCKLQSQKKLTISTSVKELCIDYNFETFGFRALQILLLWICFSFGLISKTESLSQQLLTSKNRNSRLQVSVSTITEDIL